MLSDRRETKNATVDLTSPRRYSESSTAHHQIGNPDGPHQTVSQERHVYKNKVRTDYKLGDTGHKQELTIIRIPSRKHQHHRTSNDEDTGD